MRSVAKREDAMAAVVTADYQLGGASGLTRAQLNQIIQVLGISDPAGKLPIGNDAKYVLVLQVEAKVPKVVGQHGP